MCERITFGWESSCVEKKRLFFLDARLSPTWSKWRLRPHGHAQYPRGEGQALSATRVVSTESMCAGLLDDPAKERREGIASATGFAENGINGIIKQEGYERPEQRYGFLQFMVDCVSSCDSSRGRPRPSAICAS